MMKTAKDFGLLSEPRHGDTYPLPMSWEELRGKNSTVNRAGVIEVSKAFQASQMHRIPEKPLLRVGEDYTLYASRYGTSPQKHEEALKSLGPGVVAHYGDAAVGAARKHLIWVHREHHGHDLAVEMAIAWLLYYGYETWKFKQDKPYHFTPAGIAFRKRQYQAMQERGIVCLPE